MEFLRKRCTNDINKSDNASNGGDSFLGAKKMNRKQTVLCSSAAFLLPKIKQDVKREDPQENNKSVKGRVKKVCVLLLLTLLCFKAGFYCLDNLTLNQKVFLKAFANNYILTYGDDPNTPGFQEEGYLNDYPYLRVIEDNYETIREEMTELVKLKIPRLADYADKVSAGGKSDWRTFFFKMGDVIPENRKWAPKTYDIINSLTQTNDIVLAMASITMPYNGIKPHWGYYKGFTRYHLGIMIPGNNVDKKACIRMNKHQQENNPEHSRRIKIDKDYSIMDNTNETESYYWKDGKGVVFDDTYLHDVKNDADGIRVVLFLDLVRKYPRSMWYKSILNKLFLWVGFKNSFITNLQKQYVFNGPQSNNKNPNQQLLDINNKRSVALTTK